MSQPPLYPPVSGVVTWLEDVESQGFANEGPQSGVCARCPNVSAPCVLKGREGLEECAGLSGLSGLSGLAGFIKSIMLSIGGGATVGVDV